MYSMAVGVDIPLRQLPITFISCWLLVSFVGILCVLLCNIAVLKRSMCRLSVL